MGGSAGDCSEFVERQIHIIGLHYVQLGLCLVYSLSRSGKT